MGKRKAGEGGAWGRGGKKAEARKMLELTKEFHGRRGVVEMVPEGGPGGERREVGGTVFTFVKQTRQLTWFRTLRSRRLGSCAWKRGCAGDKLDITTVGRAGMRTCCPSISGADGNGDDSLLEYLYLTAGGAREEWQTQKLGVE